MGCRGTNHPNRLWLDTPRHGVTTNVYVEQAAPNPDAVPYVLESWYERRIAELIAEAKDCGTHPINFDTCGVCGKHFAECEVERLVDDEVCGCDDGPACPGARVRVVLRKLKASGDT
jgi:hypothetical protein